MIPAGRPARGLFAATILSGSFLLFLIQPMVARMALPRLGGAPNVWNSAMLVYQVLLLGGYGYAHLLSRLPLRRQAQVQLGLLALAALTLPVGLIDLPPPPPGYEVLWVPALLALSIGPVFFAVAAQAPLMQRWFVTDPAAGEPWALYAASNLGSFAGLLAYPLLAEPVLSLHAQALGWSGLYLALVVLVALTAQARWSLNAPGAATKQPRKVPARTIMLWLLLAAVPSGLMLSTTAHLTTDIFAMPLLWIIPLGLYLLSFSIAFAERRGPARVIAVFAWFDLLLVGGLAMNSTSSAGLGMVIATVLLLFVVCTALHARLYDLRPEAGQLTLFYLVMAAGGALGGVFTALVAPLAFDWVWEHPILILAASALLPQSALPDWRRLGGIEPGMVRLLLLVLLGFAGFLLWQLQGVISDHPTGQAFWLYAAALALVGLALIPWRLAVPGLLLAMMLVQGGLQTISDTRNGVRSRSYFGIYTVHDYRALGVRKLTHGTTLHGEQSLDPAKARVPLSYYGPTSGAGLVFGHAPGLFGRHARLGVVGLGTGSLACYVRPGESLTYFEIDPAVLRFSRNGTFTFIRDCAPQTRVVLGDARLELGKAAPASFDLLAIDAFSSDAIPLHLITTEAFTVYAKTLSSHGVLLVHISNRFIDLEPVVSAIVREQGLHAVLREDNPPLESPWTDSTWIAISRDPAQLDRVSRLEVGASWRPLGPPAARPWSDDHASILPYVQWANFLGPDL